MFCIARFWHVLLLITFASAFALFPPPQTAPFATVTIFYKRKGRDPQAWSLNISNADGSNATVLRGGLFTPEKTGSFTEKIPLSGTLILTAVNPDDSSEVYATSQQFLSIDPGAVNDGVGSIGTESAGTEGQGGIGSAVPPAASATQTDQSSAATTVDSQTSPSASVNTTTPLPTSKAKSPSIATIVGAGIAGLVVLLIIIAVLIIVFRRRRRQRPTTFYRDRMVRPPTSGSTSPSASSFAGLVPPSKSYQDMRQKQRGDEESSIASFGPPYSKHLQR